MKFDYAHEISIAVGAITCVLGFLISDVILDKSDQIFAMSEPCRHRKAPGGVGIETGRV
jgi:hypothetical protein